MSQHRLLSFLILVSLFFTLEVASSSSKTSPYFVSVDWLKKHLHDPQLVLLHVGDKKEFDAEHLPGAQFIATADISTPRGQGLTLQFPSVQQLQETFEQRGISDNSRVIIYFGNDWISPTARVYLTLEYLGFGEHTSILDGGMPAWKAQGNLTTAEGQSVPRGSLTSHTHPEIIVELGWVKNHLNATTTALIDTRNEEFYDGTKPGMMPRAGHIPGAKNIPFTTLVDSNLQILNATALRELFSRAGVKKGDTVVTYCHIGQQASLGYLAARMLGYEARLYDGSFEEWSKTPELPVVVTKKTEETR